MTSPEPLPSGMDVQDEDPEFPVGAPGRHAPLHTDRPRRSRRGRSWFVRSWPGVVAAITAVIVIALDVIAVTLAGSGAFVPATVLAWCGIVLSGVAVLLGLLGAALRRGRWLGIAAVALAVTANPYVLTWLLERLSR